ncbi:MAG: hypothetical protein KME16_09025 [Scytolyngbya sp. HA4215-MV1]|nr:hypothetical protein [Scytolyngbya sp. HA4215-MV1]
MPVNHLKAYEQSTLVRCHGNDGSQNLNVKNYGASHPKGTIAWHLIGYYGCGRSPIYAAPRSAAPQASNHCIYADCSIAD